MICQYCNNALPNDVRTCPSCGAPVPEVKNESDPADKKEIKKLDLNIATPKNNKPIITLADGSQTQGDYEPKIRTVYMVLSFLFLGLFGIHNFYAGYIGRGFIQMIITVFLWWLIFPLVIVYIWNILEAVCITKDANGVPMKNSF